MQLITLSLFGSEGAGKSTLAHSLAQTAKMKLYEVEFASVPLEVQVKIAMRAFQSLLEKKQNKKYSKILLLKNTHPGFPLTDIAEQSPMKDLLKSFIIISTNEIDINSSQQMKFIYESPSLFKAHIERPKMSSIIDILKLMLEGTSSTISESDYRKIARKLSPFNGHKTKNILNRAIAESLCREEPLTSSSIEKVIIDSEKFKEQNLLQFMYL